ncbi:tetratricopeptide repeat protein [Streptomyces sp. NPDC056056]|uniref:ATP-binding protein n=1 Tax=Streptomyces sp. NPDC056056 TaxID=3345698 RepID=UPI0035DC3FD6
MAIGRDAQGPVMVNPSFHITVGDDGPAEPPARLRLLPPEVPDFTGREGELDRLEGAARANLAGSGALVVVISGQPGIGKTSVAMRVAHEVEGEFPDGVLYADLRGVDPEPAAPEEIAGRLLHALGVPEEDLPGDPGLRLDLFRQRTGTQALLLVLDNAANEQQIRPLLPAGPGTTVLVTSRNRLAGLEPVAHRLDLAVFPRRTSFEFLERISGSPLTDTEARAALEVAEHCGDLPLALRIAAHRVQSAPAVRMADLAAELRNEHERLDALEVGDLAVRKAFNLSFRKLGKAGRNTFSKLAHVPATDFGPGICAALTGGSEAQSRRSLRKLAEASLVEPSAVAGRYRMHDLLKEFAREKVAKRSAAESAADVRRMTLWLQHSALRAQNHIVGVVEVQVPGGAGAELGSAEAAHSWLEHELANAVAALPVSEALGRPEETAMLALSLSPLCQTVGRWDEWALVCAVGLRCATAADHFPIRLAFLTESANLARFRRDFTTALAHAREAHDASARLRQPAMTAGVKTLLGCLLMDVGRKKEALPLLRESLELAERFKIKHELGKALYNLGTIHRDSGELETALGYFERDLELCRELQDEAGAAETMNTIALTHTDMGNAKKAEGLHREALEIFSRLRNPHKISMVLNDLAVTLVGQKRWEESLRLHLLDAELCRRSGNVSNELMAHGNAAVVLYRMERHEEAAERAEFTWKGFLEIGDRQRYARSLTTHIPILLHTGIDTERLALVEEALEILAEFDEGRAVAETHLALAQEYGECSRWEEALTHAARALRDDGKILPPSTRALACVVAIEAAVGLGRTETARTYEGILKAMGGEPPDLVAPPAHL